MIIFLEQLIKEEVAYHGSKRDTLEFNNRNERIDYNLLGYGLYLTSSKNEAINYAKVKGNEIGYLYLINPTGNIVDWDAPVKEKELILEKYPDILDSLKDEVDIEIEDNEYIINNNNYLEWDSLDDDLPEWAIKDGGKAGYFIIGKIDGKEIKTIYGIKPNDLKSTLIKLIKKMQLDNRYSGIQMKDTYFYGDKINEINIKNLFKSYQYLYTYLYLKYGESTKKASQFFTQIGVDGVKFLQDTSDYEGMSTTVPLVTVIYNPSKIEIKKKIKI